MVTTIKQGASKKSINETLKKLLTKLKPKGVDTYKYCGKITLKRDALIIQKQLRNEWE